jgi:hypothetical protein
MGSQCHAIGNPLVTCCFKSDSAQALQICWKVLVDCCPVWSPGWQAQMVDTHFGNSHSCRLLVVQISYHMQIHETRAVQFYMFSLFLGHTCAQVTTAYRAVVHMYMCTPW